MHLHAEVPVIERRQQVSVARIVHDQRAVVAEKADPPDGPSGRPASQRQQPFSRSHMTSSAHRSLPSRQRLHQIHDRIGGDRVGEIPTVAELLPVDEDGHVLAQSALVVENVPACALVFPEVAFQDVPQRLAGNLARRARDMTLNVRRESGGRHWKSVIEGSMPNGLNACKYAHFQYIVSFLIPIGGAGHAGTQALRRRMSD